jgi:hypothetical protein
MKKFILPMLVLVLAFASAFTWHPKNSTREVDTAYFRYLSNDVEDDETNPSLWEKINDPEENVCPSGDNMPCTIQAPLGTDGEHPDFTSVQDIYNSPLVDIISYKD